MGGAAMVVLMAAALMMVALMMMVSTAWRLDGVVAILMGCSNAASTFQQWKRQNFEAPLCSHDTRKPLLLAVLSPHTHTHVYLLFRKAAAGDGASQWR